MIRTRPSRTEAGNREEIRTYEIDPDFLEHLYREEIDQPLTREATSSLFAAKRPSRVKEQSELPWEP